MNEYVQSREAKAATRVQSLWRALKAKRVRLVKMKAQETAAAASRIQELFRNRRRRKELSTVRTTAEVDPFEKPTDTRRMEKHGEQIQEQRRQYHPALHSFMSEEQLRQDSDAKYQDFLNNSIHRRKEARKALIARLQVRRSIEVLEGCESLFGRPPPTGIWLKWIQDQSCSLVGVCLMANPDSAVW